MDTEQLKRLIKSEETQEIERKESFHSGQEISKLMCGLANIYGGVILLGVSNNGTIIGVPKSELDKTQQNLSSAAQAVTPPILPSIEVCEIENKHIIVTTIQRAVDGTFHTFQGVIWARVGSTLKKIEGNQMVDFLRSKQILSFDEAPSRAKIEDLDLQKINSYLRLRKQSDYFETHNVNDFLLSVGLAVANGEMKIKNATTLFFAKNAYLFNPQNELKLVRFEAEEPVKILAHELAQSNIVDNIEKAIAFVRSNTPKSIEVKLEPKRVEHYQYPLDVIREAIVNAVAHRDYFSKDAVQVYLFSDRIEITNPGSLPHGLPRELFGTISVQRNPITYRILRDFDYVEGLGSGVPRMINSMREYGLSDPEFQFYPDFFRVVLRNRKGGSKPIRKSDDLNERQRTLLHFLTTNKMVKTKTYAEMNRISFGTAIKEINELVRFGYIKKIGTYRGAYYELST
jgi:ATP-dependent DNA helicase RecG